MFGQPSEARPTARGFGAPSGGEGLAISSDSHRRKKRDDGSDFGDADASKAKESSARSNSAKRGSSRGVDDSRRHQANGEPKKGRHDTSNGRCKDRASNPDAEYQPTSSSSSSSSHSYRQICDEVEVPYADTPYAKRIYDALRKEGIRAPAWPAEPGNPKKKTALAKFKEEQKAYRDRVRACLIGHGLIDNPDDRKRLEDAIDFKGICEDMCSDYEKITRITEFDVKQAERDPYGWPSLPKFVKKLARSAAGQEAPLPMDIRSIAALRRTINYLIDDLLPSDDELPRMHGFLWDRTRAIRRDFAFFSVFTPEEMLDQVYCLETIARFHVASLHLLSRKEMAPDDYSEHQEVEQLGNTLMSLKYAYDDCRAQGIACRNEAEFRAYELVLKANQPNIIEATQREGANFWLESDEVRTAVSLVEALHGTHSFHGPLTRAPSVAADCSHHGYFHILQDPRVTYTMACFAEIHFGQLRRTILESLKKAYSRPRDSPRDITASVLNDHLRFDAIQEAVDFAERLGLRFEHDAAHPLSTSHKYLVLDSTSQISHIKASHQFSVRFVESKRGARSLADIMHRTVAAATESDDEDSLFVRQRNGAARAPMTDSAGNNRVRFMDPAASEQTRTATSQAFPTVAANPFTSQPNTRTITPNVPRQPSPFGGLATPSPFAAASSTTASPFSSFPNPNQSHTSPANVFSSAPNAPGSSLGATPTPNPFASTSSAPKTSLSTTPPPAGNPFAAPTQPPGNTSAVVSSGTAETQADMASALAWNSKHAAPAAQKVVSSPFINSAESTPATSAFPAALDFASPAPTTWATQAAPTPGSILTPQQSLLSIQPATGLGFPPSTATTVTTTPSTNTTETKVDSTIFDKAPASVGFPQALQHQANADGGARIINPIPPTLHAHSCNDASAAQPPNACPFNWANKGAQGTTTPTAAPPKNQSPPPFSKPAPGNPTVPKVPLTKSQFLDKFSDWFVKGDRGILEEFEKYMVEELVLSTYKKFKQEAKRTKALAEQERLLAMALNFRADRLRRRFFDLWRHTARQKSLRRVCRDGRDQVKAYYEAKRAEEAKQKRRQRASETGKPDPVEEFRVLLRNQENLRSSTSTSASFELERTEDALFATGALAGVSNEREAISRIVRSESPDWVNGGMGPPPPPRKRAMGDDESQTSYHLSRASSVASKAVGGKSRRLKEEFGGGKLRRSLPPLSDGDNFAGFGASTGERRRRRRVNVLSERWKLKAMGIETRADGSLKASTSRVTNWDDVDASARRSHHMRQISDVNGSFRHSLRVVSSSPSAASANSPPQANGSSMPGMTAPSFSKRKRPEDEENNMDVRDESPDGAGSNKRRDVGPSTGALTDVQRIILEMRKMREEMEEGAQWYKEHNDSLQAEIASGGSVC